MSDSINISIIIPMRNEIKFARACIDSVLDAMLPNCECIIVDDHSDDGTQEILKSYGDKIVVLKSKCQGVACARNTALPVAKGRYVVFLDADTVVDKDIFKIYQENTSLLCKSYVAVGGAQLLFQDADTLEKFNAQFLESIGFVSDYIHASALQPVEVAHNPTCNVMYKKNILEDVSGFDEMFLMGADLDLDIRLNKLGKKMLFDPRAKVFHRRPNKIKSFLRMFYRYGFGQVMILKKNGFCTKLQFLPFIFYTLILLFIFLPFKTEFVAGYYVFFFFFFLFRAKNFIKALLYPIYLVFLTMSWNLGFLKGIFRNINISERLR